MTKNRVSGYRSADNFANMIYLILGDLDLPAQIQAITRPRSTRLLHHKTLRQSYRRPTRLTVPGR